MTPSEHFPHPKPVACADFEVEGCLLVPFLRWESHSRRIMFRRQITDDANSMLLCESLVARKELTLRIASNHYTFHGLECVDSDKDFHNYPGGPPLLFAQYVFSYRYVTSDSQVSHTKVHHNI